MTTEIPKLHPIEAIARDPISPYWQGGGAPSLRRSVVVYLDILGFSDWMLGAKDQAAASALLGELRTALNQSLVNLDLSWARLAGTFVRRQWDYKAFTDSIVIGYPVRHDGEAELVSMLGNLGMFQLTMIEAGFFVRGGISVGDLYIDRDIVFGSGLLEAIDAEHHQARDPRVVLAPSGIEAVGAHLGSYQYPESAPHNRALVRDADGQVFINYLDAILIAEDDHGPFVDSLLAHKREVERRMRAFQASPRVWSKYQWCAGYHNYFCSLHTYFDEDHMIDLSEFQPAMARLVE